MLPSIAPISKEEIKESAGHSHVPATRITLIGRGGGGGGHPFPPFPSLDLSDGAGLPSNATNATQSPGAPAPSSNTGTNATHSFSSTGPPSNATNATRSSNATGSIDDDVVSNLLSTPHDGYNDTASSAGDEVLVIAIEGDDRPLLLDRSALDVVSSSEEVRDRRRVGVTEFNGSAYFYSGTDEPVVGTIISTLSLTNSSSNASASDALPSLPFQSKEDSLRIVVSQFQDVVVMPFRWRNGKGGGISTSGNGGRSKVHKVQSAIRKESKANANREKNLRDYFNSIKNTAGSNGTGGRSGSRSGSGDGPRAPKRYTGRGKLNSAVQLERRRAARAARQAVALESAGEDAGANDVGSSESNDDTDSVPVAEKTNSKTDYEERTDSDGGAENNDGTGGTGTRAEFLERNDEMSYEIKTINRSKDQRLGQELYESLIDMTFSHEDAVSQVQGVHPYWVATSTSSNNLQVPPPPSSPLLAYELTNQSQLKSATPTRLKEPIEDWHEANQQQMSSWNEGSDQRVDGNLLQEDPLDSFSFDLGTASDGRHLFDAVGFNADALANGCRQVTDDSRDLSSRKNDCEDDDFVLGDDSAREESDISVIGVLGEGQATNSHDQSEDGVWDLVEVLGIDDILDGRTRCDEDCDLVACSVWAKQGDEGERWYGCLDCQKDFFGGFPAVGPELPIKAMSREHKEVIAKYCADKPTQVLPDLPEASGDDDDMSIVSGDYDNLSVVPADDDNMSIVSGDYDSLSVVPAQSPAANRPTRSRPTRSSSGSAASSTAQSAAGNNKHSAGHEAAAASSLNCPVCDKLYKKPKSLQNHISKEHPDSTTNSSLNPLTSASALKTLSSCCGKSVRDVEDRQALLFCKSCGGTFHKACCSDEDVVENEHYQCRFCRDPSSEEYSVSYTNVKSALSGRIDVRHEEGKKTTAYERLVGLFVYFQCNLSRDQKNCLLTTMKYVAVAHNKASRGGQLVFGKCAAETAIALEFSFGELRSKDLFRGQNAVVREQSAITDAHECWGITGYNPYETKAIIKKIRSRVRDVSVGIVHKDVSAAHGGCGVVGGMHSSNPSERRDDINERRRRIRDEKAKLSADAFAAHAFSSSDDDVYHEAVESSTGGVVPEDKLYKCFDSFRDPEINEYHGYNTPSALRHISIIRPDHLLAPPGKPRMYLYPSSDVEIGSDNYLWAGPTTQGAIKFGESHYSYVTDLRSGRLPAIFLYMIAPFNPDYHKFSQNRLKNGKIPYGGNGGIAFFGKSPDEVFPNRCDMLYLDAEGNEKWVVLYSERKVPEDVESLAKEVEKKIDSILPERFDKDQDLKKLKERVKVTDKIKADDKERARARRKADVIDGVYNGRDESYCDEV